MTSASDRAKSHAPAGDAARSPAASLRAMALAEGLPTAPNLSRGELLAALFAHRLAQGHDVRVEGALELLPEGFGFVRSPHFDYEPSPHDAYVSPSQVRALNLKTGQHVAGPVRAPRGNERFFALGYVDRANGVEPALLAARVAFAARTPIVATRPLHLPADDPAWRALAFLAPWCRGQRILVATPASWSRPAWLAGLAEALHAANPDLRSFLCLLDQRPEDLAAAKARGEALAACEVTGSTFDQPPERHAALAELVLARAMREVEAGHDVVLLVDSLTALTQATQRTMPASGRWLCPGLDAQALLAAKRVFAAARACAEGGSLSVVATAVDGPAAFEATVLAEFRHRGNSEVVVAAALADAGALFPFDAQRTRTRPEDDGSDATTRAAAQAARQRLAAAAPDEQRAVLAGLAALVRRER